MNIINTIYKRNQSKEIRIKEKAYFILVYVQESLTGAINISSLTHNKFSKSLKYKDTGTGW